MRLSELAQNIQGCTQDDSGVSLFQRKNYLVYLRFHTQNNHENEVYCAPKIIFSAPTRQSFGCLKKVLYNGSNQSHSLHISSLCPPLANRGVQTPQIFRNTFGTLSRALIWPVADTRTMQSLSCGDVPNVAQFLQLAVNCGETLTAAGPFLY